MEDDEIRPDLGIFFHSGLFDKVGYSSQNNLASRTYLSRCSPPADPDLHIRGGGGGGGHPDSEIDKGGQSPKKNIKSICPLKQKTAHGRIALKRAALLLK